MARGVGLPVLWAALLLGMWMMFVVTTSVADIAWGAGSAVFTTAVVWLVRRFTQHHIEPRARWVLAAAPLAPRLFTDTWKVFLALFRQLFLGRPVRAAFRAVKYEGVYRSEPEASAGDGFVIVANSLTPNSIVLDIDRIEGVVLLHQLVPQSPAEASQQLVRAR